MKQTKKNKQEQIKYEKYVKEKADNFKLTPEDLHNLFDLFYIVNWQDYKTIELNRMDKWFKEFYDKIEEIILADEYGYEK